MLLHDVASIRDRGGERHKAAADAGVGPAQNGHAVGRRNNCWTGTPIDYCSYSKNVSLCVVYNCVRLEFAPGTFQYFEKLQTSAL